MKATYVVILDDNTNNPKRAYFSDKDEALKSLESLQAKVSTFRCTFTNHNNRGYGPIGASHEYPNIIYFSRLYP